MLALLKTAKGKGHIELLDIPVPKLRDGEVLIRVRYAGICGTDLKIYADQAPYRAPVVLGHEFSGEIVQLGSGVSHWSVGDPVVSQTAQVICGHCSYCRTGRELMCAARQSIGYGVDGAFAEYIRVHERLLHRIPDGLSLETAVLAEPLAVAVHALMDHTHTLLGQRTVIFGPGPIGVLTALLADRAGGHVSLFGIRSDADRLDYIRNTLGLSGAVCTDPQQLKNRNPADIAVDCSGSQTAARQILGLLKPNGQWIQVGLTASEIALPYDQIVRKELCVQGSFGHRWHNWETGLKLLIEHQRVFNKVITHRHMPGQWKEGFEQAMGGIGLKHVIEFENQGRKKDEIQ